MSPLLRYHVPNGLYFITCVTYHRHPILLEVPQFFLPCWRIIQPEAWIVLPDHFHALINVGEHTISNIMHNFKITYSRWYRDSFGQGKVWQDRYYDRIIKDEKDWEHHLNYIHFNPIKHGLCEDAFAWELSSIRKWMDR